MFLAAIALRWRAIARSISRDAGWREDVASARELFAFEDREQELADLLRTEAFCLIEETGDVASARKLLSESRRSHNRRGESRGAKRSAIAMRLLTLGSPQARRVLAVR
jgi:hypothetical protein